MQQKVSLVMRDMVSSKERLKKSQPRKCNRLNFFYFLLSKITTDRPAIKLFIVLIPIHSRTKLNETQSLGDSLC